MRTLIVEKNPNLVETLASNLLEYGYQCDVVETLKDAEYYLNIRNYDLVLMASELDDGKAFEVIPDIKANTPKTVVIVLASNDNDENEFQSITNGADDYITAPSKTAILLARIDARTRPTQGGIIQIEDLLIDLEEKLASYQGRELPLHGKVFDVFAYLALHRNEIVSKEQLLDANWEEPELVTPNVIEVAINQIRQKVDKPFGITTIETIRRRGYRLIYPELIG
jgi:two-component system OmpR family response regulator